MQYFSSWQPAPCSQQEVTIDIYLTIITITYNYQRVLKGLLISNVINMFGFIYHYISSLIWNFIR